jgi:uncharacterized protein (TIGR00369 family)
MAEIPAGFARHDRKSPVTDAWEPLYSSRDTGVVRMGFVLATNHTNSRGLLHGGVIASLADNAMGLSLGMAIAAETGTAPVGGLVTTSLSVDFLGGSEQGQWIEIVPRVVWVGGSSGVVEAMVTANGAPIARANASFRVRR